MKGPTHGAVEYLTASQTYGATYDVINGMVHLHITGHNSIIAIPTPDATHRQSALNVLKIFADAQASL